MHSAKRLLRTALSMALMPMFLVFGLIGCGAPFSQPCPPSGIVNQTSATDDQLKVLWQDAQRQLATQPIPTNPVTSPANIRYAPPDPRAWNVTPGCRVKVISEANVLPPSGPAGFACAASPSGYCGGMTLGHDPWTVEIVQPDLLEPGATGWEFQNVILEKLGYNVSGR